MLNARTHARTHARTQVAAVSSIEVNVRAVLEDLAMRRRLVVTAIRDIALFYRLDPQPWLEDATAPRDTLAAAPDAHVVTSDTTSGTRDTTRPDRAPRPTTAPTADPEILAALQAAREPMTPRELAAALKTTVPRLRERLKPMVKAKRVLISGTTMSRRITLAA